MVIFFHHLLNEDKREAVVEWAVEDGLGGFSKAGHPGVIFLVGRDRDRVHAYVRRLRTLRWQTMEIRLEHQGPAAYLEALLTGVRESTRTALFCGSKNIRAEMESYYREWPNNRPVAPGLMPRLLPDAEQESLRVGSSAGSTTTLNSAQPTTTLRKAPIVLYPGRSDSSASKLAPYSGLLSNEEGVGFLELGRHNGLGLLPTLCPLWSEVLRTAPMDPARYRLPGCGADGVWRGVSEELWRGMTPAEKRAFDEGGAGPYEGGSPRGGATKATEQSVMQEVARS